MYVCLVLSSIGAHGLGLETHVYIHIYILYIHMSSWDSAEAHGLGRGLQTEAAGPPRPPMAHSVIHTYIHTYTYIIYMMHVRMCKCYIHMYLIYIYICIYTYTYIRTYICQHMESCRIALIMIPVPYNRLQGAAE